MKEINSEMTVKFIIAGGPDSMPYCMCCLCYSGVDLIGTSLPMLAINPISTLTLSCCKSPMDMLGLRLV